MIIKIPVQINAIDLAIETVKKMSILELPESASDGYKNGFKDCSRVLLASLRKLERLGEDENSSNNHGCDCSDSCSCSSSD